MNAPPPPDRITEAWLGGMGEGMMQATRARIEWIRARVRGPRVLDIGCSQGITAILLAREGLAVTAVDIDPRVIADARAHLAAEPAEVRARVEIVEADIATLPVAGGGYDSVILGEVLEHLEDPAAMLTLAAAHAAPGGRLVVTVPFGVNPFPDHRQTFYLAGPHALIARDFVVEEAAVLGRWAGFAATKPEAGGGRPLPPAELARLLPEAEAEFLAIEERLRAEAGRLRRKLRVAEPAAEKAAAEAVATRTAALQARLAAQARALAGAEAAAAAAERALATLRESPTFRLGATLAAAARSPRAALGLPLALARLWRAGRRARAGAPAAAALGREAASLEGTARALSLEARLEDPTGAARAASRTGTPTHASGEG